MASSLIRDALANAQQELAKKRALPPPHSPSQSSSSHFLSASSSAAANKKHKPSHPHRPSPSSSSSSSSASSATAQFIKDAVAASRSELESKRKLSLVYSATNPQHVSVVPTPPIKPLSPYERFINDHWDDDEYDGLGDDERRTALNRRFEAVSFSKKETWTSEWKREMEQWERQVQQWDTVHGMYGIPDSDSRAGTADNGTSSSSRPSNSHRPATNPARTTKPASSSSTTASFPTSSSSSAPPSSSSQPNTAVDFSPSPFVTQHYSFLAGQLSLVPYINKHNKAFLTLTFPITRITALVSLLPLPPTVPVNKLFPQPTVATISRAIDYFIQHMSALVLASAVASGSRVLRPEDYRAVIMRRSELWWLRWAQEDDRDVRGRYRTGQLAALEKKRRDAEDRARGRKLKGDDGGDGEDDEVGEDGGGDEDGYMDEGRLMREDGREEDGSRMDEEEEGGEEDEEDDDRQPQGSGEQNRQRMAVAADGRGDEGYGISSASAASSGQRVEYDENDEW